MTAIVCDLYLRLSDGRNENGSFIDREAKLRQRAEQRGWAVNRVVIENDLMNGSKSASAFKRRKIRLADGSTVMRVWRPGFRSMLNDLATGEANAILAEDLDRTMRDPRDAQDLIDAIRDCRGNAHSLSGSLSLTDGGTDAEILMTEVMVSVGRKSSADTARRVSAGRERSARNGKFGGGRRPYGFGPDGVTVCEHEASAIRDMATAVLGGQSLRTIAYDLRMRGEPTVTGAPWQPTMIKEILSRLRNIARMTYKGEDAGPAPWAPILTVDEYTAVCDRLHSPDRDQTPGRAPRWLLSGMARCVCGTELEASNARQSYRCKALRDGPGGGGHVRRNAQLLEQYVAQQVVERLSDRDAFDLLVKARRPNIDVDGLRAEAKVLRGRLEDLGAAFAEGEIDRATLAAGTKRLKSKLEVIDGQLSEATSVSPIACLVSPFNELAHFADTAAKWLQLPLGDRRAIVDQMMTVTVLPTDRRPGFNPAHVRIEWKG